MQILYTHLILIIAIETVLIGCFSDAIKIKCSNVDEFYYADSESHCTAYYKCIAIGQPEIEECNSGSRFDFYTQTCTRSSGICYEPICTGRSNGIYQDTTHACRRSYTCFAGHVTSIDNCPSKHLHNGQRCVHQDLVSCDFPETTAIGYPFAGDQRCTGKADGYYAIDCEQYIVCTGGEVFDVQKCADTYLFHPEMRQCLPRHLVTHCSGSAVTTITDDFICAHKHDGANVDPLSSDCSTFIMCKNGKFVGHKQCNQQAVFNGEICVPIPFYNCPLFRRSVQSLDICNNKSNGFYPSTIHGCSSYVRCMNRKVVEVKECPSGQYFDATLRNCAFEKFPDQRKCHDRGLSVDCDGLSNGLYMSSNCEAYYHCHNGYKTEYKCSVGNVFNGERCISKYEYNCPEADGDTFCISRMDGYYKDPNDGCRTYHYCSKGHKITYLCEDGYIFNNKVKKCERKHNGSHCRQDFICYGKSDGYHADLQSNCRNYVYCKNNEKITQLTCRDNNVFNGQKCVPPHAYACPSQYNHRQLNCMPKQCIHQCKKDGFFPDLKSDCHNYYFCIDGKPSLLSCPAGKRFNGEICVAEDKFICPIFCEHKNDFNSSCPLGGYVA